MRLPNSSVFLGATIFLLIGCAHAVSSEDAIRRFDLPNGLHVILRPVRGAQQTAIVTLFSIGGDHDPQGASGLAHYVEHLYVTAALGDTPARTTEQFVRQYPLGWNAQTGDDYTVFATVIEPNSLDAELRHHAERMGDLQIAEADLRRELPRIENELANMFGRMPALGAMNLARERVRPTPLGGRKGGQTAQLKNVTVGQLQSRWHKFYKPGNATLVVVGDFKPADFRPLIEAEFEQLPRGDAAPPAQPSPEPDTQATVESVTVRPVQPTLASAATLAFRVPRPGDRDYAPFLYIVSRLLVPSRSAGFPAKPTEPSLRYSFLDDPNVLFVAAELNEGETADDVASRLREFIDRAVHAPWNANERQMAKQNLAFFLDTMPLPDRALAQNVYGVAFGLGRRHQLGLNGQALARQLDRTRAADIQRVGKAYLSANRGAVVAAIAERP